MKSAVTMACPAMAILCGTAAVIEIPLVDSNSDLYTARDLHAAYIPAVSMFWLCAVFVLLAFLYSPRSSRKWPIFYTRFGRVLTLFIVGVMAPIWVRAARVRSIEYAKFKFRTSFKTRADICLRAAQGNVDRLAWYFNHGADADTYDYRPDLGSQTPETIMTTAIEHGRANVVEYLLHHGASVNKPGGIRTPIQAAAETGNVNIGKMLLDHGADVDGGNVTYTPLMLAACDNRYDFAKLLLSRGADITLKSNFDQTAEQLAQQEGHLELAHLIKQFSNRSVPVRNIAAERVTAHK